MYTEEMHIVQRDGWRNHFQCVRGLENPFNGALYALTVAYEYAGAIDDFKGEVSTQIKLPNMPNFRLVRVDVSETTETWTDLEYTYADGILTFKTNKAGLYLLLSAE